MAILRTNGIGFDPFTAIYCKYIIFLSPPRNAAQRKKKKKERNKEKMENVVDQGDSRDSVVGPLFPEAHALRGADGALKKNNENHS